jgi:hypothetical protein
LHDVGAEEARTDVWRRFDALLGRSSAPERGTQKSSFVTYLSRWLAHAVINLTELEFFFLAFLSTTSVGALATMQRDRCCQIHEFTDPNLLFSPWGNSLSATLFQLALVRIVVIKKTTQTFSRGEKKKSSPSKFLRCARLVVSDSMI